MAKYSFRGAIIAILFFSNTVIFLEFARLWESEGTKIEDVGHYDCAVVLGGMFEWDNSNERLSIRRGGDRIWQTINLYHLGKVDKILISGSNGYLFDSELQEAKQLKEVLIENGIPEEDILIEPNSRNTFENAVESKKVLDQHPEINSILLVTSALHMPRAKGCFENAGFKNFDCFTTDHYTGKGKRGYKFDQIFLPNVSNMVDWHRLIHEWVGYVAYRIMGYI
ncbi:MAG: YdcF family protein [Crocinitomicaceae bacterium]|nr:YdcF family protein [Crocinitomicaceae bacterium]